MKTISGFCDRKVWIQGNSTILPLAKCIQLWCLKYSCFSFYSGLLFNFYKLVKLNWILEIYKYIVSLKATKFKHVSLSLPYTDTEVWGRYFVVLHLWLLTACISFKYKQINTLEWHVKQCISHIVLTVILILNFIFKACYSTSWSWIQLESEWVWRRKWMNFHILLVNFCLWELKDLFTLYKKNICCCILRPEI